MPALPAERGPFAVRRHHPVARRVAARARGLVVLLAAGCGEPRAPDLLGYGEMPRVHLEPGTAFCADAREEACHFVDLHVAAVGPDGRVALAGTSGDVVQFDAGGRFVRRIGRQGGGPGEYRSAMAIAYDSAAVLHLFDVRTWRLVRFDSSGAPLDARPVEPPAGIQDAGFAGSRLVLFVLPGGSRLGDSVTASFLGLDGAGAATVEVGTAPARALTGGDGGRIPILPPFTPRPRWSAAPDGAIYFAAGGPLEIVRADVAPPRTVAALAVNPPAVTDAELDSARAVILRVPGGRLATAARARQQGEEAIARAERHHPMITGLTGSDAGTVWAREGRAVAPDTIRWNGFDVDGHPLGHVLLPVRSRVLVATRERLLIVDHDADGVPTVRWYRMRPTPRSGPSRSEP